MIEQGNVTVPDSPGETLPAVVVHPEVIQPAAKKKPDRLEREVHKKAFAHYFALGPTRTIKKVAEEFKLRESTVLVWSSVFSWKEKIIELESRSKESEFREKAMDLLLLTLDSLVKRNKKTGGLTLANKEKQTTEKLKMCIDSFKRLRDDSREDGENVKERGTGGVRPMVQVNIIGKEAAAAVYYERLRCQTNTQ